MKDQHTGDTDDETRPQGRLRGVPYDLRRPTARRWRARTWNPDDDRVLTPQTYGWGWQTNLHALGRRLGLIKPR